MKKKILSIVLTLAMLLSTATVLTTTALAAETTPDGSQEVLEISTYDQLRNFIASLANFNYAGKTVTVTQSITVNSGWTANDKTNAATAAPTGENAKILDTTVATNAFAGTFRGKTGTEVISGLYINGDAFFPSIAGATIQNITFDNCYTVGDQKVDSNSVCEAIIAGRLTSGKATFNNVTVSNSKMLNEVGIGDSTWANAGAFIAWAKSNTEIDAQNCLSDKNYIHTSRKTSLASGFFGQVQSTKVTIDGCTNTSEVYAVLLDADETNHGYKAGGFIGAYTTGTTGVEIKNSVNSGKIHASTLAAGFVGDAQKKVTIDGSTNSGNITAGNIVDSITLPSSGSMNIFYSAGFIGRVLGVADTTVSNSTNSGKIEASASYTNAQSEVVILGTSGGIIGENQQLVTVTNCVNTNDISGDLHSGGIFGNATKAATIKNCVNSGNFTGGVNNNSVVGGLVGNATAAVTAESCANLGSFNIKGSVGGLIGMTTAPATVTDFINLGNVAGTNKIGGLAGIYQVTSGNFTRVLLATTPGKGGNASCNGGILGYWQAKNTSDATNPEIVAFKDVFYVNANTDGSVVAVANQALGMYWGGNGENTENQAPLTQKGKLSYEYTATGVSGKVLEATGTWVYRADYNTPLVTNGLISDITEFYGLGIEVTGGWQTPVKFQAFNLGKDWVVTNELPMPIGASKLLNKRATGDKAINYIGLQTKIKDTSISEIRFIAETNGANLENYSKVGFKINYIESGDSPTYVRLESECENGYVYSELNAYAEDGTKLDPIKSQKEGYCLTAVTVSGLNDSKNSTYKAGTYTFTITPYLVDLNGAKVEGESFAIVLTRATDGGACTLVYAYAM